MAHVKWITSEFTPNENQVGMGHSWSAKCVIDNETTNVGLAEKISRRTGYKSYECQSIVAAIAEVALEEILEGNRIILSDEKGTKMVSLYPQVKGSISDKDVQANPEKYHNAQVATEEMLTSDLLSWTVGATVGVKFSKNFSLNKQAQKVKLTTAAVSEEEEEEPTSGNQGGTTPTTNGENSEP